MIRKMSLRKSNGFRFRRVMSSSSSRSVLVLSNISNMIPSLNSSLPHVSFTDGRLLPLDEKFPKFPVIVGEPSLIVKYAQNISTEALSWVASTWAGVDYIFKNLKSDILDFRKIALTRQGHHA